MRHLNMRFVRECPYASCVLTGAGGAEELGVNIREWSTPVPDDVWNEARQRIAELDQAKKGLMHRYEGG
jgi:hypothetical protein